MDLPLALSCVAKTIKVIINCRVSDNFSSIRLGVLSVLSYYAHLAGQLSWFELLARVLLYSQ